MSPVTGCARESAPSWGRLALFGATGLLIAIAARPDDVVLTNGRVFEDVVVTIGVTDIRVALPGGDLSLPRSAVARIEPAASTFGDYLARKRALRGAGAAAWLELAEWARAHGLAQSSREAALTAAELEPQLPGLAPLLRAHGYALAPSINRWVPYEEYMRLQGFVDYGGAWMTPEEAARHEREREQRQLARDTAVAERAAREAERELAELELASARARAADAYAGGYHDPGSRGVPLALVPGWTYLPTIVINLPPAADPEEPLPPQPPRPTRPVQEHRNLGELTRVPGSLLPARIEKVH